MVQRWWILKTALSKDFLLHFTIFKHIVTVLWNIYIYIWQKWWHVPWYYIREEQILLHIGSVSFTLILVFCSFGYKSEMLLIALNIQENSSRNLWQRFPSHIEIQSCRTGNTFFFLEKLQEHGDLPYRDRLKNKRFWPQRSLQRPTTPLSLLVSKEPEL